jgi:hypothetical protein
MRAQLILTDGGLETTLLFHEGVELPHFAAFPPYGSTASSAPAATAMSSTGR